jgi:hypothetical protein
MSPEIQTFVSTTTRSARSPDLPNGVHHVALDFRLVESVLLRDAIATLEQVGEAVLPLVLRQPPRSLGLEPCVYRLAYESGDGCAATLAKAAEEL